MGLLATGKVASKSHMNRVLSASSAHPILVLDQSKMPIEYGRKKRSNNVHIKINGKLDVIDGLHRLARAYITGEEYICAYVVPWHLLTLAEKEEFRFSR